MGRGAKKRLGVSIEGACIFLFYTGFCIFFVS